MPSLPNLPSNSKRPPKLQVLSILIGLLLATVAAECVGRSFVAQDGGFVLDAAFGLSHKPGHYVYSSEGFSTGRFTRDGFRDFELTPPRAGATDVAVYGDSYTEACYIPAKETFAHVAQSRLPQFRFNIYAISSGSMARYIQWNKAVKTRIDPQVAIYVLNESDFTSDVVADLNGSGPATVTRLGPGCFETRTNEHAVSSRLKAGPVVDKLMSCSLPYLLALNVLSKDRPHAASARISPTNGSRLNVEYLDWCFSRMRVSAPRVLVLYIPSLAYHREPASEAASRMIERYLSGYRGDERFHILNMRDSFSALYEDRALESHGFGNTLPGFGHINATGHRQVAEAIVKELSAPWPSHP